MPGLGFAIAKLLVIGVALGLGAAFLYLWILKRFTKKDTPTKPPHTPKHESEVVQKQISQLRRQLDSGLLTKEEYAAKNKELLQEKP